MKDEIGMENNIQATTINRIGRNIERTRERGAKILFLSSFEMSYNYISVTIEQQI